MPAGMADIIQRHTTQIIERWVAGAARSASARGLSRPQLLDVMPQYLDSLGHNGDVSNPGPAQEQLLEGHLSRRLRQGYELYEVIVEFAILARVMADVMAGLAEADQPPSDAVARLFAELHLSTTLATRIFSEHLLEDEQREKRYGRLIHEVVAAAQRAPRYAQPQLDERLGRVSELVMEAMCADTAVLMVFDRKRKLLVTAAAAGLGRDALRHDVTTLDPSSFVGRVAQTIAGPVSIDVRATDLEVSEMPRRCGVRRLLGQRLPSHGELLGVLYVGRRAPEPGAASDLRQIQSLGDHLSLLLDSADLFSQLHERFDELQTFVDLLAHDLRGPLAGARIQTQLLMEMPGELRARVPKILARLDAAASMITDLLDAHRLGAGEPLPLRVRDGDFDAVARDVAADANTRGARVVVTSRGRLRGTFGVDDVRRALWNLVSNGIKFGDTRAPIRIDIVGDERGVVASVHNDGPAIPHEDQERLFVPFARARQATREGTCGWGLGLSLVQGCAQAHGGSVALSSEPGEGTTVRLMIPWQPAECGRHLTHPAGAA